MVRIARAIREGDSESIPTLNKGGILLENKDKLITQSTNQQFNERGPGDMQTATQTNQAVAGTLGDNAVAEPLELRKRIGSTVYVTNIYFNNDAAETMDDMILRMIRAEAREWRAVG